jgi:hypothetical protein
MEFLIRLIGTEQASRFTLMSTRVIYRISPQQMAASILYRMVASYVRCLHALFVMVSMQ